MLMRAVVSSLILIKRRPILQLIPANWRELWMEWQLRGLILHSLTTQIVLIILGNRRKYIPKPWISIVVWSAYLAADYIAILALGILSNELGDFYDDSGVLNKNKELTAFWAPLLLLHLGGTDSITAYSLEDNELWKRHSFVLIFQAVGTLYILFMAWTGSRISILFVLMFIVGLIKYLERVWVLYSASEAKFKDSIPDTRTSSSSDPNIMDECKLKQLEGYQMTTHQVLQVEDESVLDAALQPNDKDWLVKVYGLLDMVKRVFADYTLTNRDRDATRSLFKNENLKCEEAFEIVEIELGLMYDLLYTKAKVIYSYWGIAQRIICICLTSISFAVFSWSYYYHLTEKHKKHHSKVVDISITFTLLGMALFVESFAFVQLIISDQTLHWLIKHRKTKLEKVVDYLQRLFPRPRWSKYMGQFSLLSISLGVKPLCLPFFPFPEILNKFPSYQMLEILQYDTPVPVTDNFKYFIFQEVKSSFSEIWLGNESEGVFDPKDFFRRRGGRTLEKFRQTTDLEWSTKLLFDRSILVWHLATEICYFRDLNQFYCEGQLENPKLISQYMLYLLVKHPNTLPIRMGQVKLAKICDEVRDFVKDTSSYRPYTSSYRPKACSKLIRKKIPEEKKSLVLLDAQKVALTLMDIKERDLRWKILKNIWLEMLGYAAYQWGGRNHAKQLRHGGELLTHFWLLMVHFGLSEHFRMPRRTAVAELVLR